MKRCFKCGQVKPLSEFYIAERMADGHTNKCKVCCREESLKNKAERAKLIEAYKIDRELVPGDVVGDWTIVKEAPRKANKRHWLCRCKCGKTAIVGNYQLRQGKSLRCKCCASTKTATTHGMYKTRLNRIWSNMKTRCFNENFDAYKNYGGRGITVCQEWLNSFTAFYEWAMANGYSDDLTLDRVDNDGIYCPTNCRWATRKQQANNTRRNKK